jgi:hypothetical protein
MNRRSQLLLLLFCATIAAGFITAQYVYIWVQKFEGEIQIVKVS